METEDLKEYLSMLVDVEKDCYLLTSLKNKTRQSIAALQSPGDFSFPPKEPFSYEAFIYWPLIIIGAIIAGIIAEILISDEASIIFMLLGGFVPTIVLNIIGHSDAQKDYDKKWGDYDRRLAEAQEKHENNKKQYENSLIILNRELVDIDNKRNHFDRLRNDLYSADIVFPKYRNFVMLTSIYEYICSGRCSTLEGADGAYNLLELEMRMDRIVSQLDTVIQKLDQIQNNQFLLYSAINEANSKLYQLIESNEKINSRLSSLNCSSEEMNAKLSEMLQTSELAAYYTQRVREETHYFNRMNYYAGKYDNAGYFLRRPPE